MAKIKNNSLHQLQNNLQRTTRAHFAFVGAYIGSMIILYAWRAVTNEAFGMRWTLAGALLAINTVIWFISHMRSTTRTQLVIMTLILAVADLAFAAVNVYLSRGMASIYAFLFIMPLLTVAILRNRLMMISAAILAAGAYSTAAVLYFTNNYGEGYKVELWGTIFMFCSLFFVIAWQVYTIFRPN